MNKKIITFILLCFFSIGIVSASDHGKTIRNGKKLSRVVYHQMKKQPGVMGFTIPTSLLKYVLEKDSPEYRFLGNINKMRFLVVEKGNPNVNSQRIKEYSEELSDFLNCSYYEQAMSINSADQRLTISFLPGKNHIDEILICITEKNQLVFLDIIGKLSTNDLQELMKEASKGNMGLKI